MIQNILTPFFDTYWTINLLVFGDHALHRADFLIWSQIGPKLVPIACYKGFQPNWWDVTHESNSKFCANSKSGIRFDV